jgi:hypothetical protein
MIYVVQYMLSRVKKDLYFFIITLSEEPKKTKTKEKVIMNLT